MMTMVMPTGCRGAGQFLVGAAADVVARMFYFLSLSLPLCYSISHSVLAQRATCSVLSVHAY